jgi:hypothetical protein
MLQCQHQLDVPEGVHSASGTAVIIGANPLPELEIDVVAQVSTERAVPLEILI